MQLDKWLEVLERDFENAAKQVHRAGGYNTEMLKRGAIKNLREQTFAFLTEGISTALEHKDNVIPDVMRTKMTEDVFIFAGCKTEAQLRAVGALLRNADGSIKPREKFIKEVQAQFGGHNAQYLTAEYEYAVASSQAAAKWHNYVADGDRYDLQYRTAMDDRVRESHSKLHNVTLGIDAPFWDLYFTPNGWRCRCVVVQVRKGKYKQSDSAKAIEDGNAATPTEKLKIFRYNPGKQGAIFPPHHPYFKALDAQQKKDLLAAMPETATPTERHAAQKAIYDLDRVLQFEPVQSYKNGGEITRHTLASTAKGDYDEVLGVAQHFAENGSKVEIMPEIYVTETEARDKIMPDAKKGKNPDLRIDGVLWEVESTTQFDNVTKRLSGGYKQADNVVLLLKYEQNASLEHISNLMFNTHKDLNNIVFVHPSNKVEKYKRAK